MRMRIIFISIIVLCIFIAGYFIIQSLDNKENSLSGILNTNSPININSGIKNINDPVNLNIIDPIDPVEATEVLNINAVGVQPQDTGQTEEQDSNIALFDKAYATGDRSICRQIKDETSESLCNAHVTSSMAKSEKNIKLCEEITDEFYRNDCHDNVIMIMAVQEKNKEKCGELIDQKRMEECVVGAR